jgi:hypothetical protein
MRKKLFDGHAGEEVQDRGNWDDFGVWAWGGSGMRRHAIYS